MELKPRSQRLVAWDDVADRPAELAELDRAVQVAVRFEAPPELTARLLAHARGATATSPAPRSIWTDISIGLGLAAVAILAVLWLGAVGSITPSFSIGDPRAWDAFQLLFSPNTSIAARVWLERLAQQLTLIAFVAVTWFTLNRFAQVGQSEESAP